MAVTADDVLKALPLLEEHVLRVDPRGRVFIRSHGEHGFYFAVQLRTASAQAMSSLPPTFNGIPLAAELLRDVITHFRPIGGEHWQNTKFGDKHLNNAGMFEPIFVLRATDSLSEFAVAAWIEAAKQHGVDSLKIRRAEAHLASIKEWQPRSLPT